ncbi:hypothetical protein [Paenibacillus segetis]|uniref:hypothetical protein n=1 Tax=Paenibacillus segetis TaxID=1325360 RepID=UPI00166C2B86|nr:hypothetical protein [Paenibacillus segetis]
MDTWRDGWVIFKKELRGDRMYLIGNVIFMLYLAFSLSVMMGSHSEAEVLMKPLSDFLMLLLVPLTGFFFSRRSFNYIKEDSYTRMLKYYRTLPIPITAIMKGRIIQLFMALIFNGVLFYPLFFWFSSNLRAEMNIGQFIVFILTWTGYALLINGVFIYFELLKKGRTYLWLTISIIVLVVVITVISHFLGTSLVMLLVDYSSHFSFLSPLMWGALVVGGLGFFLLIKITKRKLIVRDLRS